MYFTAFGGWRMMHFAHFDLIGFHERVVVYGVWEAGMVPRVLWGGQKVPYFTNFVDVV